MSYTPTSTFIYVRRDFVARPPNRASLLCGTLRSALQAQLKGDSFLEAFCGKSPAATLPPLSSPSSGVDAHDFASSLPMNLKTDSTQLLQELAAWV